MSDEQLIKLKALGNHLSSLGWVTDEIEVSILSLDEEPEDRDVTLGKAFMLKILSNLRKHICLPTGEPKPTVVTSSRLVSACSSAISEFTRIPVEASVVADVVIELGLHEICKNQKNAP